MRTKYYHSLFLHSRLWTAYSCIYEVYIRDRTKQNKPIENKAITTGVVTLLTDGSIGIITVLISTSRSAQTVTNTNRETEVVREARPFFKISHNALT